MSSGDLSTALLNLAERLQTNSLPAERDAVERAFGGIASALKNTQSTSAKAIEQKTALALEKIVGARHKLTQSAELISSYARSL